MKTTPLPPETRALVDPEQSITSSAHTSSSSDAAYQVTTDETLQNASDDLIISGGEVSCAFNSDIQRIFIIGRACLESNTIYKNFMPDVLRCFESLSERSTKEQLEALYYFAEALEKESFTFPSFILIYIFNKYNSLYPNIKKTPPSVNAEKIIFLFDIIESCLAQGRCSFYSGDIHIKSRSIFQIFSRIVDVKPEYVIRLLTGIQLMLRFGLIHKKSDPGQVCLFFIERLPKPDYLSSDDINKIIFCVKDLVILNAIDAAAEDVWRKEWLNGKEVDLNARHMQSILAFHQLKEIHHQAEISAESLNILIKQIMKFSLTAHDIFLSLECIVNLAKAGRLTGKVNGDLICRLLEGKYCPVGVPQYCLITYILGTLKQEDALNETPIDIKIFFMIKKRFIQNHDKQKFKDYLLLLDGLINTQKLVNNIDFIYSIFNIMFKNYCVIDVSTADILHFISVVKKCMNYLLSNSPSPFKLNKQFILQAIQVLLERGVNQEDFNIALESIQHLIRYRVITLTLEEKEKISILLSNFKINQIFQTATLDSGLNFSGPIQEESDHDPFLHQLIILLFKVENEPGFKLEHDDLNRILIKITRDCDWTQPCIIEYLTYLAQLIKIEHLDREINIHLVNQLLVKIDSAPSFIQQNNSAINELILAWLRYLSYDPPANMIANSLQNISWLAKNHYFTALIPLEMLNQLLTLMIKDKLNILLITDTIFSLGLLARGGYIQGEIDSQLISTWIEKSQRNLPILSTIGAFLQGLGWLKTTKSVTKYFDISHLLDYISTIDFTNDDRSLFAITQGLTYYNEKIPDNVFKQLIKKTPAIHKRQYKLKGLFMRHGFNITIEKLIGGFFVDACFGNILVIELDGLHHFDLFGQLSAKDRLRDYWLAQQGYTIHRYKTMIKRDFHCILNAATQFLRNRIVEVINNQNSIVDFIQDEWSQYFFNQSDLGSETELGYFIFLFQCIIDKLQKNVSNRDFSSINFDNIQQVIKRFTLVLNLMDDKPFPGRGTYIVAGLDFISSAVKHSSQEKINLPLFLIRSIRELLEKLAFLDVAPVDIINSIKSISDIAQHTTNVEPIKKEIFDLLLHKARNLDQTNITLIKKISIHIYCLIQLSLIESFSIQSLYDFIHSFGLKKSEKLDIANSFLASTLTDTGVLAEASFHNNSDESIQAFNELKMICHQVKTSENIKVHADTINTLLEEIIESSITIQNIFLSLEYIADLAKRGYLTGKIKSTLIIKLLAKEYSRYTFRLTALSIFTLGALAEKNCLTESIYDTYLINATHESILQSNIPEQFENCLLLLDGMLNLQKNYLNSLEPDLVNQILNYIFKNCSIDSISTIDLIQFFSTIKQHIKAFILYNASPSIHLDSQFILQGLQSLLKRGVFQEDFDIALDFVRYLIGCSIINITSEELMNFPLLLSSYTVNRIFEQRTLRYCAETIESQDNLSIARLRLQLLQTVDLKSQLIVLDDFSLNISRLNYSPLLVLEIFNQYFNLILLNKLNRRIDDIKIQENFLNFIFLFENALKNKQCIITNQNEINSINSIFFLLSSEIMQLNIRHDYLLNFIICLSKFNEKGIFIIPLLGDKLAALLEKLITESIKGKTEILIKSQVTLFSQAIYALGILAREGCIQHKIDIGLITTLMERIKLAQPRLIDISAIIQGLGLLKITGIIHELFNLQYLIQYIDTVDFTNNVVAAEEIALGLTYYNEILPANLLKKLPLAPQDIRLNKLSNYLNNFGINLVVGGHIGGLFVKAFTGKIVIELEEAHYYNSVGQLSSKERVRHYWLTQHGYTIIRLREFEERDYPQIIKSVYSTLHERILTIIGNEQILLKFMQEEWPHYFYNQSNTGSLTQLEFFIFLFKSILDHIGNSSNKNFSFIALKEIIQLFNLALYSMDHRFLPRRASFAVEGIKFISFILQYSHQTHINLPPFLTHSIGYLLEKLALFSEGTSIDIINAIQMVGQLSQRVNNIEPIKREIFDSLLNKMRSTDIRNIPLIKTFTIHLYALIKLNWIASYSIKSLYGFISSCGFKRYDKIDVANSLSNFDDRIEFTRLINQEPRLPIMLTPFFQAGSPAPRSTSHLPRPPR